MRFTYRQNELILYKFVSMTLLSGNPLPEDFSSISVVNNDSGGWRMHSSLGYQTPAQFADNYFAAR